VFLRRGLESVSLMHLGDTEMMSSLTPVELGATGICSANLTCIVADATVLCNSTSLHCVTGFEMIPDLTCKYVQCRILFVGAGPKKR
jgi:hypothetical protein